MDSNPGQSDFRAKEYYVIVVAHFDPVITILIILSKEVMKNIETS